MQALYISYIFMNEVKDFCTLHIFQGFIQRSYENIHMLVKNLVQKPEPFCSY